MSSEKQTSRECNRDVYASRHSYCNDQSVCNTAPCQQIPGRLFEALYINLLAHAHGALSSRFEGPASPFVMPELSPGSSSSSSLINLRRIRSSLSDGRFSFERFFNSDLIFLFFVSSSSLVAIGDKGFTESTLASEVLPSGDRRRPGMPVLIDSNSSFRKRLSNACSRRQPCSDACKIVSLEKIV